MNHRSLDPFKLHRIGGYIVALVVLGTIGGLVVRGYFSYQAFKELGKIQTQVISFSTDRILPDTKLTPGAINPDITQANIGQNICNKNWSTSSIRPPSSYTTKLKIQQIKEYGYSNSQTKNYEEDHLISLELGGNPTDPKNLWPESYLTKPNAKDKDKLENLLHKKVCAGELTLKQAQGMIATDWIQAYKDYRLDK